MNKKTTATMKMKIGQPDSWTNHNLAFIAGLMS